MAQQTLTIELREKTGKGICRRLRADNKIPGVVYGKGMDSISVSLSPKELSAAVAGEGGINHLITLQGGGSLDGATVIVSDLQRDCLRGTPTHVDLHKISMTDKLHVVVPVTLTGTAAGVKAGGLLDVVLHEVEIECLPGEIPDHIEINVTNLNVGDSIHVAEIIAPAGVKILTDPKASVVSIIGKGGAEAAEE